MNEMANEKGEDDKRFILQRTKPQPNLAEWEEKVGVLRAL
jgi:hypothetical protein